MEDFGFVEVQQGHQRTKDYLFDVVLGEEQV